MENCKPCLDVIVGDFVESRGYDILVLFGDYFMFMSNLSSKWAIMLTNVVVMSIGAFEEPVSVVDLNWNLRISCCVSRAFCLLGVFVVSLKLAKLWSLLQFSVVVSVDICCFVLLACWLGL